LFFFLKFFREREGGWRRLQGAGGEEGSARALRGPNPSLGRLQTYSHWLRCTLTLLLTGTVEGSIQTGTRKDATPLGSEKYSITIPLMLLVATFHCRVVLSLSFFLYRRSGHLILDSKNALKLSSMQKVAEESEDTPLVAIGAEQADTGRDRYR
jgi:hypothetical protein